VGLRSVLLPSHALTGGWIESSGWHGWFLADGNWRNCVGGFSALGLLGATTTTGYWLPRERQRKYFLWVSMVVNLVLLGFFKYFDFFVSSASSALQALGFGDHSWALGIIVPAGISFYTFQAM